MDDHLVFDGVDPVAENNARRDERRREREDAETIRHLLGSRARRAFFRRLLESCHIYATAFRPGEPETTFFRMGEEFVGKKLQALALNSAPDLYMIMLEEAKKEEDRVAAVRSEEDKRRSGDDATAIAMQGFDLPKPPHLAGDDDRKGN